MLEITFVDLQVSYSDHVVLELEMCLVLFWNVTNYKIYITYKKIFFGIIDLSVTFC